MVKVIKPFEFLHPIEKLPDDGPVKTVPLLFKGNVSLLCSGPHPIFAGWYRLATPGRLEIQVHIKVVIDLSTDQDVSADFLNSPDMLKEIEDKIREFSKSKFVS